MAVYPALAQSTATYSYDVLGRLVRVSYPSGAYVAYKYDKAGNRTLLVMSLTPNTPPVANADTATLAAGATVDIDVLANDTDADLHPLSIIAVAPLSTTLGTASLVNNNTKVRYVANPAVSGVDNLVYTISDSNGGTAQATLAVTVTAAQPPPTVANKALTVQSGASNSVDATPTAGAWTSLQMVAAPDGSKGTASITGSNITYTANGGATSQLSDTLTYRAVGPGGTSNTATVNVTITAATPPPPTVTNQTPTVTSGSSVPINVAPSGAWTTVQLVTSPTKGTTSISGSTITYTANSGITSTTTDTFNYRAIGPGGASNTATITVTINPAPVAPVVDAKFPIVGSGSSVGVNLTPVGGGAWNYVEIVTPPNGTKGTVQLSGVTATYYANSGIYTGTSDTFTYRAYGPAGYSNTASVNVTINPQTAPPTVSPKTATVTSGQQVIISLLPSGNWSSVQLVTPPNGTKGTAVVSGYEAIYTANSGIATQTTDTFTYNASGAGGTSNTATVTVTINPAQVQFAVQASPLTYYRLKSGTSWGPAGSIGATVVSGGSGNYSYEWIRASGDANTSASSASSPSTAFTRSGGVGNGTWVSYWFCRVTDLGTGLVRDTNEVQVTIEFDSGS